MLKADINHFQRLNPLFYLMFRISIKELQICKYTSKIFYSRQKMYTTLYLKLPKRAECSSRWCKMSCKYFALQIVIKISNQPPEKCVQQPQMVCNSIVSLFLSPILVVVLLSSSKEIYLHGSTDVQFYIVTFQKKNMIRKTSFFSYKSPCLPLNIFKLLNKREERSNNVGKTASILPHFFS